MDGSDAATGKARRFCETLVKLVMQRHGLPVPNAPHAQRINALFNAGIISADLKTKLDDVRLAGNASVHGYVNDRQKAADVVKACFELGIAADQADTGNQLDLTYSPPVPGANVPSRELLQSVERRLTELQEALDASLARGDHLAEPAPVITITPATPGTRRWQAGSTIACGSATYLVHEPVERIAAEDGSWTLQQADGHCLDTGAAPVRLRGVLAERSGTTAARMTEGLNAQASYLQRARNRSLPMLLAREQREKLLVTVASRPAGSSWAEMFGLGEPLDPLLVPLALDAAGGSPPSSPTCTGRTWRTVRWTAPPF